MDTLPEGAIIGTSAVRRSAQFKSNYPQYSYRNIRGNLNTRLRKLDNQEGENYCAMILAAAGVNRMGWSDRISQHIDIGTCMHAGSTKLANIFLIFCFSFTFFHLPAFLRNEF